MSMEACVQDKILRLSVPKLYSTIVSKRCRFSIRDGGFCICLTLYKTSNQDWRFLKA